MSALQSKKERIIGFFTCLALGALCFGLVCTVEGVVSSTCDGLISPQALALSPVIVLKSRKFAALFTFGSLFSLGR